MIKPLTRPQVSRPPLRGICLVVTGTEKTVNQPNQRSAARAAATKFPQRPDAGALSESSPLVMWLDAVQRAWRRLIPEYPPPMPIGQKKSKGEWR